MSSEDIGHEQAYVSMLYGQLDELRERAESRLAGVLRETGGNAQTRGEREAAAARYAERIGELRAAEPGLCFGRLDLVADEGMDSGRAGTERRYIGRLGLFDESDDHAPLLVDWRAPAARPFYVATAATPDGVRRRRHIRTRDRTVVAVQDDLLDPGYVTDPEAGSATGDATLLAALAASRIGRMRDIVATIQAEQDRVIRSDHRGVLLVEGGPGTGKTAVALHRAAYLLYTYRRDLSSRGVLIVGPNPTFLRYIDQVLPSLGESAVVPSTIGDLLPGVRAVGVEPDREVAVLKGSPVMAEVVAAAVRDRQRVPEAERQIVVTEEHPGFGYQREKLLLHRSTCERARELARSTRRPHNQARSVFVDAVVGVLARQVADRLGADPYAYDALGGDDAPGDDGGLLSDADVAVIARDLRSDAAVMAALNELWPVLTPQRLVRDLFALPARLESAAPQLTAAERALLHRDPAQAWTPADVPLLDEAAELLGEDGSADRARAERRRQLRREYAQGVLDIVSGSRSTDVDTGDDPDEYAPEVADLLDADLLAARYEQRDGRSVAERAAADRRWVFGHVIVDEAQELSAMAWRMVMRRCPSRSLTVVGDLAQTGAPGGGSPWEQVLTPYLPDGRWRRERLSVNYRTPAEIMAVAAGLLTELDPAWRPPQSVRSTGMVPWQVEVPPAALAERLPEIVVRAAAGLAGGNLAVVVPGALLERLAAAVTAAVPGAVAGPDPAAVDAPVAVLPVRQVKGLEFDAVLVVEPTLILTGSPRGVSDLYVALTRATRDLGVVHTGRLPAALGHLAELGQVDV